MKKWLLGGGAIVIAAGVGLAWYANVFPKAIAPITVPEAASFDADQVAAGENLTRIGGCVTCHQPEGGRAMSGGVSLPTPFGTLYGTNITPDAETGIGTWSLAAFTRAMREGIDRQGRHLYPAFPYDHFAAVTDEDMASIYAYLMSQEPVSQEATPNELPFPFSMRPILAGWKLLFHRPAPFQPDPSFTEEENRGAYLAQTLGHCSACHMPRNALGAVEWSKGMAGGEAHGWLAPPLGAQSISGVAWDLDSYADYLFDGWSEQHAIAAGPMSDVVDNLYEADEDDVFAIAAWLAKITPPVDEAVSEANAEAIAALDLPESFDGQVTGEGVTDQIRQGAGVFVASCLKCHKDRSNKNQPLSLGLTYAANAPEPLNLFNVVLHGVQPGFGSPNRKMEPVRLAPEELAAVAAFVRWQFTDRPAWDGLAAKAAAASAGGAH